MGVDENKTSVIPDFFYEFIGRIIPGLVVISLYVYWSEGDFSVLFSKVGLSVFVFVVAWVIGITLDQGICVSAYYVAELLDFKNWLEEKVPPPPPKTWEHLCIAKQWERANVQKASAQTVFFRGMSCISALVVLVCMLIKCGLELDTSLPVLVTYNQVFEVGGAFFFCVFFLCWKSQRKYLQEFLKNWVPSGKPEKENNDTRGNAN